MSQSHINKGGATDELIQEPCFLWERGALILLIFTIFYMHNNPYKNLKEGEEMKNHSGSPLIDLQKYTCGDTKWKLIHKCLEFSNYCSTYCSFKVSAIQGQMIFLSLPRRLHSLIPHLCMWTSSPTFLYAWMPLCPIAESLTPMSQTCNAIAYVEASLAV